MPKHQHSLFTFKLNHDIVNSHSKYPNFIGTKQFNCKLSILTIKSAYQEKKGKTEFDIGKCDKINAEQNLDTWAFVKIGKWSNQPASQASQISGENKKTLFESFWIFSTYRKVNIYYISMSTYRNDIVKSFQLKLGKA